MIYAKISPIFETYLNRDNYNTSKKFRVFEFLNVNLYL